MNLLARLLLVLVVLPRALAGTRPASTRAPVSDATPSAPDAAADEIPPASGSVRVARVALVAAGVLLIGVALGALVAGVPFGQWTAIGVWLVVALILHDGLLAPLLIVGARLLRRGSARLPWGALAAVQVAVAVGFSVTLVAFPAIRAQQIGARNPSVLIFDYPAHLAAAWAGVGVVVAAAIVWGAVRRTRDSRRG